MIKECLDVPGEDEGEGGRQKSQSELWSQTLPQQLSGELEDSEPGDNILVPGTSFSSPPLTSSLGSDLEAKLA